MADANERKANADKQLKNAGEHLANKTENGGRFVLLEMLRGLDTLGLSDVRFFVEIEGEEAEYEVDRLDA